MSDEQSLENRFRSVNLAYDIAIDSYDVLGKRLESIDGRLQTMLTILVSSTVAMLAIAANRRLDFHSKWFYGAAGFIALAVIIAVAARLYGKIEVLNPSVLNSDKWLACSEWEFKNLVIRAADNAFTKNNRLINQKWKACVVVIVIFSLGAVCLVMWVIRMTSNA
jgi:hypothetical protein